VEVEERLERKVRGKPGKRDQGWTGWEGHCHGAGTSAGAEYLHRQGEELAIVKGKAVIWIIVTLEFRRYPRAEDVPEVVSQ
jgi:hypothetical protein